MNIGVEQQSNRMEDRHVRHGTPRLARSQPTAWHTADSETFVSNLACVTVASHFTSSRNTQDGRQVQQQSEGDQQGNLQAHFAYRIDPGENSVRSVFNHDDFACGYLSDGRPVCPQFDPAQPVHAIRARRLSRAVGAVLIEIQSYTHYEISSCDRICATTFGPCKRLFSMKMSLLTLPAVMTPMM